MFAACLLGSFGWRTRRRLQQLRHAPLPPPYPPLDPVESVRELMPQLLPLLGDPWRGDRAQARDGAEAHDHEQQRPQAPWHATLLQPGDTGRERDAEQRAEECEEEDRPGDPEKLQRQPHARDDQGGSQDVRRSPGGRAGSGHGARWRDRLVGDVMRIAGPACYPSTVYVSSRTARNPRLR